MKIATFQLATAATPAENRAKVAEYLENLEQPIDLLVVPEMFTTGFSMDSEKICEKMGGETLTFLQEQAKKYNIAITGSVATYEENGDKKEYFNRMFFVYNSGEYSYYDKHHLFRMAGEQNHYSQGNKRVIVEYKGFRILLQVCYDLRFPVYSRNRSDYDMAIYVAAWPKSRVGAWNKLLMARAIENQAYVISANSVGIFEGVEYSGGSHIIDFKGELICSAVPNFEQAVIGEVELEPLNKFREAFPAFMDADEFTLA